MENQRLILFIALSIVLLLLFQAWQEDYGTSPPSQERSAEAPQQPQGPQDVPKAEAPRPQDSEATPDMPSTAEGVGKRPLPQGERIRVVTDLFEAEIDTTGGDLRRVALRQYPVVVDQPQQPTALLSDEWPIFVAQSGLLSQGQSPDHHTPYQAEQSEYRLADGKDELKVRLRWSDDAGLAVTKTYTFYRDSYRVDVVHEVENGTAESWAGRAYHQLQRSEEERESFLLYTYTGGAIYSPTDKFEKYDFKDLADSTLSKDVTGGWVSFLQHYFLGAWIPEQEQSNHFYSKALGDDRYVLGFYGPAETAAAGKTATFNARLYAGPKEQHRLEQEVEGLELTVDYGILTFLSKPLFWFLEWIHKWVGNWGWSIVLLTLAIKIVFYKLSETSFRSMAKMRKLQPKIVQIRERYGDDRQRMTQAMMDLYKKEKINPLGGCLPILVQIPVFIALYWVLIESVELRHAPFMLWINDLSSKDPYYVLPLLMGASMFLQMKLNPPPPDPLQAKIMQALPIVFTLFFAFFPSGLVLYWLTNNVLSIIQQWYITRRVEQGEPHKA